MLGIELEKRSISISCKRHERKKKTSPVVYFQSIFPSRQLVSSLLSNMVPCLDYQICTLTARLTQNLTSFIAYCGFLPLQILRKYYPK